MQLNVEVSDQQYLDLLTQAKDEVRATLTREALEKHLKEDFDAISIVDYLNLFDVYGKASDLNEKCVKDLTRNEKLILALRWLGYENLLRR